MLARHFQMVSGVKRELGEHEGDYHSIIFPIVCGRCRIGGGVCNIPCIAVAVSLGIAVSV